MYEIDTNVDDDKQWNDKGYTPKMSFAQYVLFHGRCWEVGTRYFCCVL